MLYFLPKENLKEILEYLDIYSIINISYTSKKFRSILIKNILKQKLIKSGFQQTHDDFYLRNLLINKEIYFNQQEHDTNNNTKSSQPLYNLPAYENISTLIIAATDISTRMAITDNDDPIEWEFPRRCDDTIKENMLNIINTLAKKKIKLLCIMMVNSKKISCIDNQRHDIDISESNVLEDSRTKSIFKTFIHEYNNQKFKFPILSMGNLIRKRGCPSKNDIMVTRFGRNKISYTYVPYHLQINGVIRHVLHQENERAKKYRKRALCDVKYDSDCFFINLDHYYNQNCITNKHE